MEQCDMISERSQDHWKHFNPKEKNVLDLGCGRHQTYRAEDHSPIYFLNEGANKVIGVDANHAEIAYYEQLKYDEEKLTFILEIIDSSKKIVNLVKEHSISAIKCDIEGYETHMYDITKKQMNGISELAIEYHDMNIRERMIEKIAEWGFSIKYEGKFTYCHAPQMGVLFCEK